MQLRTTHAVQEAASAQSHETCQLVGTYTFKLWNTDGSLASEQVYQNLITTAYKNLLAAIAGVQSGAASAAPTIFALGTGTTTPSASDIKLGTEGYRQAISSLSSAGTVVYCSTTVPQTSAPGTWTEAGLFVGGQVNTVDSGTLMSHVAINVTKPSTQSLTADYTLTFA